MPFCQVVLRNYCTDRTTEQDGGNHEKIGLKQKDSEKVCKVSRFLILNNIAGINMLCHSVTIFARGSKEVRCGFCVGFSYFVFSCTMFSNQTIQFGEAREFDEIELEGEGECVRVNVPLSM
jgi:hypothetical protein